MVIHPWQEGLEDMKEQKPTEMVINMRRVEVPVRPLPSDFDELLERLSANARQREALQGHPRD